MRLEHDNRCCNIPHYCSFPKAINAIALTELKCTLCDGNAAVHCTLQLVLQYNTPAQWRRKSIDRALDNIEMVGQQSTFPFRCSFRWMANKCRSNSKLHSPQRWFLSRIFVCLFCVYCLFFVVFGCLCSIGCNYLFCLFCLWASGICRACKRTKEKKKMQNKCCQPKRRDKFWMDRGSSIARRYDTHTDTHCFRLFSNITQVGVSCCVLKQTKQSWAQLIHAFECVNVLRYEYKVAESVFLFITAAADVETHTHNETFESRVILIDFYLLRLIKINIFLKFLFCFDNLCLLCIYIYIPKYSHRIA